MLRQILLGVLACIVVVKADLYPDLYSKAQVIQNPDDELMGIYRLPNDTVPEHYSVRLVSNVHRNDFSFSGEVDININVVQTTSVITLHHRQLVIGSVRLTNAITPTVDVLLAPIAYDETTNFLSVPLASTVAPLAVGSKYILHITFTGTLRTDQGGFYRSSYAADDGTRRWLALTQFAPTDARHGFPCYDEPALRATFDISITHGANYSAISNMDIAGTPTSLPNGMVTTTFQRMISTPTYLIAYVVSDYTHISQANSVLPRQSVYARPNAIAAGAGTYALNAGIAVLNQLSTYFGIPYGLSKLDQVAVNDFWFGAMENWGIIIYREETLLLFRNSTFLNERRVATVISHELTHQWFGNLVTPKWWTWIWLNEGFATLFENYVTDWINPDWKILDAFILTLQNVMQADATTTIRPMSQYVESHVAIQNIFDTIAYPKSGSVLRMFLHAFTENSFKKGLSNYLNANAYKAADEEDLFQQIEIAVKQDGTLPTQLTASAIMGSWTRQSGFPLVTVTRNYADGSFELSQERYFTVKQATQHSSLWWIPYNFATASSSDFSNTAATGWMQATARTLRVGDASVASGDWLVLNKQQSGYYRVQYDTQNYQLIANELSKGDFKKIHLVSRAQIIDDVFDFAKTERLNYTIVFDIIKYLERDTEFVPWAAAFNGLTFVDRMYSGSSKYEEFTEFVVTLLKNLYSTTGVLDAENEPHYHKQSRISAMNWACKFGLEECLTSTNNLLKEYLSTNIAIHQNNFEAILCNGVRTATQQEYENLWAKLKAEENTIVRQRIITAMACASDKEKLMAFIETSVGSAESEVGYLSAVERYRVFTEVAANGQNGASVAIEFLKNNIDAANSMYGSTNVNAAIVQLARYSVTDDLHEEFKELLQEATVKTFVSAATFVNADAAVTENQRWVERNQHDIEIWISEYESGASTIAISSLVVALLMVITRLF